MLRVFVSALFVALLAACEPGIDDRDALVAQAELKVPAGRHCPHCGRIESKRKIVPGVTDPLALPVYEYTLRMADGSRSVFQETLPTTWRVGERLSVIDGTGPAAN